MTQTISPNQTTCFIKGHLLFLLLSLIIFGTTPSRAQGHKFEWAIRSGNTEQTFGNAIALDAQGNVLTTGTFSGTIDFDPGPSSFYLTSKASRDTYIQKLDANGHFLWAKQVSSAEASGITTDKFSNIYIAGSFRDSSDFNPGAATFYRTSKGDIDIFMLKLDSSGSFVWAKTLGAGRVDMARNIVADTNNNIYISGVFCDTVDFDPAPTLVNRYSKGDIDLFVLKTDADGNFKWVRQAGGPNTDMMVAMAIDKNNQVIVGGLFRDSADFGEGAVVPKVNTVGVNWDCYLWKLNDIGNTLWTKTIAGANLEEVFGITTDAWGNIYTTGGFDGAADFDPGPGSQYLYSEGDYDAFVQKLSADGNFIWVRQIAGSAMNVGSAVATDIKGNVYLTGYFNNRSVNSQSSFGGDIFLSAQGSNDLFIEKWDSIGQVKWVKQISGSNVSPAAIISNRAESLFLTGSYEGTTDFDPGQGSFTLNSFYTDMFLLKLQACEIINPAISQTACNSYKWFDQLYEKSGVYKHVITKDDGCDSVLTLNLSVTNLKRVDTVIACNRYTWRGKLRLFSGMYLDTGHNASGCDSLFILYLTIKKSSFRIESASACYRYTWHGKTYTTTGTYRDTLFGANTEGCDSILMLQLTIKKGPLKRDTVNTCQSTYTWRGNLYTVSGIYTDTVSNAPNCDSIFILQLNFRKDLSSYDSISACYSYNWRSHTYYSSGVYKDTITTVLGCDSILWLVLTITIPDTAVMVVNNTLEAQATGSVFQWVSCDQQYAPLVGDTASLFSATVDGYYAVIVYKNGCGDTSSCYYLTASVGLKETFGRSVSLYPNPAGSRFAIYLGDAYHDVFIQVKDLSGKTVYEKQEGLVTYAEVELKAPAGFYFVTVSSGTQKRVFKLIRE